MSMSSSTLRQALGILRSLAIYHGVPFRKRTMRALYRQFMGPGDVCFDVGAHVGSRVGVWADLGARVIAIEPQPQCMTVLRWLYGRRREVTLVDQAVGEHPGRQTLHISENAPTVTTLSAEWVDHVKSHEGFAGVRWDRRVEVEVITLDALIERHGEPAFIKIDVEGYEPQVLRGLSRPVRGLSFEYLPMAMHTAFESLDVVCALGQYEFNWSPVETHRLREERWLDADGLRERLRVLGQQSRSGDVYARRIG